MISLTVTAVAIAKLFFLGVVGYAAVRVGAFRPPVLVVLTRYVIFVALPCLIVDTFARVLESSVVPALVLCFGAGIILVAASMLLALGASFLVRQRQARSRGLFVSLASMQNSGYLPIPLVAELLRGEQQAEGLLYTFMYMFVMSIVFWSGGIVLISGSGGTGLRGLARRAFNPPVVSLAAGFLFLIPEIKAAYGQLSLAPALVNILGSSTIPLVPIILGASLAQTGVRNPSTGSGIYLSAFVKLVLIPGIVLCVLAVLRPGSVFAFALLLQACMPAATNHIVIVREYGGNAAVTARALLVHYLGALVTIPLFLSFFQ